MVYLVAYELRAPGKDYNGLYAAIQQLGAWWHYLHSSWIVDSNLSAAVVRDRLVPHIDGNDQLLVVRLAGDWASWLTADANAWLTEHLAGA